MNNTLKIILVSLLILVLALGNYLLFSKKNELQNQLKSTRQLAQRMQGEVEALDREKAKITAENEKLQSDAATYLSANMKLEGEKEKFRAGLEKAQKALEQKEANLDRIKASLKKLEKKMIRAHAGEESKAGKEAEELRKQVSLMDGQLKAAQALHHYNMGVALTQAKHFNEAVAEYEKSLELKPDNAEAHYNLGLIYDQILDNPTKAVFHYRAYLKLKPKSPDKADVEKAIKNLKS